MGRRRNNRRQRRNLPPARVDPAPAKSPGFYEHSLHPIELRDLQSSQPQGYQEEINLLRVLIRRTMELAKNIDELREMRITMRDMAGALHRLALLEKSDRNSPVSPLAELETFLAEAMDGLLEEMGAPAPTANHEGEEDDK